MFSMFKRASDRQDVVLQDLSEEQLAEVAGGHSHRWHESHHRHHHHHHHHHMRWNRDNDSTTSWNTTTTNWNTGYSSGPTKW